MAELTPHPVTRGEHSEVMVLAALVRTYKTVLVPFGQNHRYDYVIESKEGFLRIQVKTGRLLGRDRIKFMTRSKFNHRGAKGRGYHGEADYFAIYCPQTDGVYLVPVSDFGSGDGSLRLTPTRNGQAKGVRWARSYQLAPREGFEPPALEVEAPRSVL